MSPRKALKSSWVQTYVRDDTAKDTPITLQHRYSDELEAGAPPRGPALPKPTGKRGTTLVIVH